MKVYQVGELTLAIKSDLEDHFGAVAVEGEITNLRRPSSGHLYFDLKDAQAQLRAVFFRGAQAAGKAVPLENGLRIQAQGDLTVYPPQGQYQLVVRRVIPAGQGALQAAFEELKRKLAAEGLFEPERKRRLPALPQRIGVVTSPTGAVIRDILNVLTRRFPNLWVQLAPVHVQGAGAAREIAAALDLLNARGEMDVLIVARGGGSLEDLWAFNEEIVARAVARSRLPVISAVGHETDFTICDFVADLRAPTPSAAAELVVGRRADFEQRLADHTRRLRSALRTRWLELRRRADTAAAHFTPRAPRRRLAQLDERVRRRGEQLRGALLQRVRRDEQTLDFQWPRLRQAARLAVAARRQRLDGWAAQLRALDPQRVLERGYTVTLLPDGRALRAAAETAAGQTLTTRTARGAVISRVESPHPENTHAQEKC